LKFLGYIDASRTDEVAAAMVKAVSETIPFQLTAGGLGVFPNPKRLQVIWVDIGGEVARLNRLHQRLEEQLVALGFAAEARDFSAHLTLGRLRHDVLPWQRQELGKLVAETGFNVGSVFRVDALSLMKSQLTPRGAIYSRLAEVPFKA
jgi:2'-5' RNA ligase